MDTMSTANEIRGSFLDYFAGHGHEVVASSPLVLGDGSLVVRTRDGFVHVVDPRGERRSTLVVGGRTMYPKS